MVLTIDNSVSIILPPGFQCFLSLVTPLKKLPILAALENGHRIIMEYYVLFVICSVLLPERFSFRLAPSALLRDSPEFSTHSVLNENVHNNSECIIEI